ncbi:MAG: hypothetical protein ACODAG_09925 [Myxococcota bacterium]
MVGRRTTAQEARARMRADVSRLLARSLAQNDVTQAEAAGATGARPSIVQRWCDRDRRESVTVADLALLPREVALDLLQWIASLHDAVVQDAPDIGAIDDDLEHLRQCLREVREVEDLMLGALTSGVLSGGAASRLVQHARAVRDAMTRIEHRARGALEQGPVVLRGGER